MLRFITAGESHGPQLTVIVDGLPAGLPVTEEELDVEMRRRQRGHGRSERQTSMERDHAEIVGGVRGGLTIGSPVALVVQNRVYQIDPKWQQSMAMAAGADMGAPLTRLRPGHADLAGAMKYGPDDVRNILERSSARETAARVAAGGLARLLLRAVGIEVNSRTLSVGPVTAPRAARPHRPAPGPRPRGRGESLLAARRAIGCALRRPRGHRRHDRPD